MSTWFGTHLAYLAARDVVLGETSPHGARSLWVALGLQNIAVGDRNAASVGGVTSFVGHEYDGAGYSRQALSGVVIQEDTSLHRWILKAATVDFSALGPASDSPKAALIILSSSASPADDGSAYLVGVIDGADFGLTNGDSIGRRVLRWAGGIVLFGPNCDSPSTGLAQALDDGLFTAQNFE